MCGICNLAVIEKQYTGLDCSQEQRHSEDRQHQSKFQYCAPNAVVPDPSYWKCPRSPPMELLYRELFHVPLTSLSQLGHRDVQSTKVGRGITLQLRIPRHRERLCNEVHI